MSVGRLKQHPIAKKQELIPLYLVFDAGSLMIAQKNNARNALHLRSNTYLVGSISDPRMAN
jgi:hypothetical protein